MAWHLWGGLEVAILVVLLDLALAIWSTLKKNCKILLFVGSQRTFMRKKYEALPIIPDPPNPSGNGTVPVKNTTKWLMLSASGMVMANCASDICWKSVWTCRKRINNGEFDMSVNKWSVSGTYQTSRHNKTKHFRELKDSVSNQETEYGSQGNISI